MNMVNRIINADDFGKSEAVNHAIDACFLDRRTDRCSIMVTMSGFINAKELSVKNGYSAKVGLHLDMTAGTPLLVKTANSVLCKDGRFTGELLKNKYRFYMPRKLKKVIADECNAQIQKFRSEGFTLMHVDSHQHIHTRIPFFLCIRRVLKQNGVVTVRTSRNISCHKIPLFTKLYRFVFNTFILGKFRQTKYLCSLEDDRRGFAKGNTEIMIHPCVVNERIVDITGHLNIEIL